MSAEAQAQAQARTIREAQAAELTANIVIQRWQDWCRGAGAASVSGRPPRSRRERLAFLVTSARIALATVVAPTPPWADKWQWRGVLANPMILALTETAPEIKVERCDEDCGGANIRVRWGAHVLHLHFTTVELGEHGDDGDGGGDGLEQGPSPEGASSHGRRVFVFERGGDVPPELAAILRGSLPPEVAEAMGLNTSNTSNGAGLGPSNKASDPEEVV